MNKSGFTLIEVLVVIGIVSLLLTFGTLEFNQYTKKASIEGQTRKLYADLMELRSRALFEKHNKVIHLTASSYTTPVETVNLKQAIEYNGSGDEIVFDTRGLMLDSKTICVVEENGAAVDSIIVSMARVQLGKRKRGMTCEAANIVFK
jgi:prepilin-type N-terminal cleavage/methylation domain-containing protein